MSTPTPLDVNEYKQIIAQHQHILQELERICIAAVGSVVVEGNCFCQHQNIKKRLPELIPKQVNVFSLGMHAKNIIEVGFNAGHSALLFMLANPESKMVCFDICEHPYTIKCFEYLQGLFGKHRLELIVGDSTLTIPKYIQDHPGIHFDVYHLDGSHDPKIARQDFENVRDVADIIIFDDTSLPRLNVLVNEYIKRQWVEEILMMKTFTYEHRILRRIA